MSGRGSRMGRGNKAPMLRMSSSSPSPGSGDDETDDDAPGMMGMKQQWPPSSTCPVPTDVSQAMQMCGAALTTAVQSGNRKVTIDILTPDLNPSSRGYDRANMHSMLIGVAQNMRRLVAGDVVFVFMDREEADVAKEAFGMSITIAADVGEDLIGCASLDEPLPEGPPPDVFVLVAPTNTKEKKVENPGNPPAIPVKTRDSRPSPHSRRNIFPTIHMITAEIQAILEGVILTQIPNKSPDHSGSSFPPQGVGFCHCRCRQPGAVHSTNPRPSPLHPQFPTSPRNQPQKHDFLNPFIAEAMVDSASTT